MSGGVTCEFLSMNIQLVDGFEKIVATENLLEAWREFLPGKRGKRDVQEFQLRLMDNILSLRADLINGTYRHGGYEHFKISDPKPRDIHKASVRDRLLHHAMYRVLYPFSGLSSGVDFLGWIHFPDHRVLRTATKRRMIRRIAEASRPEVAQAYRGLLTHGNAHKLFSSLGD